jgi:hypothetical protein
MAIDRDDAYQKYTKKKYELQRIQRVDRNGNPVRMKMSFEEWLDLWEQSGKWHLRGNRKGCYCECRTNDLGDYEVGNVRIDTVSNNSKERNTHSNIHSEETKQKIREARSKQVITYEHHNRHRKRLVTPKGTFNSIREAADVYGFKPEAFHYWRRKRPDLYYILED